MTSALSIQSVRKQYGSVQALKGISFEVAQGDFFGLLGPNGAGKTTLISILAGLTKPSAGSASVMGHDVQRDFRAARLALGVVPQELVFDPFFTVRETLRWQSGYFGIRNNDDWIDEILVNLDLMGKADANMRALSGGMKRRVLVGQALVHRPPVILLDEPTAGVDVELRQSLWKFIRRLNQQGHTIVLTTHYLEEAQELCNRIAMLKQGEVVTLDRTQNLLRSFAGARIALRLQPLSHVDSAPREHQPYNLPLSIRARISPESQAKALAGERFEVKVDDYDEVPALLAQIQKSDWKIEDLEVKQADLEDVFIKTMRGANP